ncbi:ABC transporter ATP-binding protein [Arthrobacter agilis]|uniref:ABC transporter ATP-binding protein n=1 Tax=Arthrobacter agilis TaxID=37921 RepID=UPI000B357A66|nr:ABC transporter ATP-binding protein [Arthrobacter agilis]OUM40558.1 heme ABC transporter ATP-binding protein [Arthrobacter agilis]PPB45170.1 ABC transporter ATP-binding protein [Arthrobacter agilis]TPV27870.1 ABC transporter ATP-binding protein [Arthrobacter agilis]VDR31455.1 Xylose import ATP-binding protein XylG [Arthrobacter agilis]
MKLELIGITKRFGSLVANDSIDLVVEPGQVHSLLGENGAGKSTLMNVLYGLYDPSEGEILVNDKPVTFKGPGDAMASGIGMVHQHFMLVPVFTVAENVALGNEATKAGGMLDLQETRTRIRQISDQYGFDVDPDAVVEDLPVGVQQRVEIIKALVRDAEVLILDEPTAVLTPKETDELLGIMAQLKADGKSIVFISHKLREVKAVSDVITVIRRGKVVGTADPDAPTTELASLMVGRSVSLTLDKQPATPGAVTFSVRDLTVQAANGQRVVDGLSFDVAEGEILAIAGVQGNGQTELTEAIMGLQDHVTGSISLGGDELVGRRVKDVIRAGVGFVPEDRSVEGLVGTFSVAENLILNRYDGAPFAKGLSMSQAAIARNADEKIAEYDVRTQSASAPAGTLSGGNQQKVVMAREFSRPLKLFIASQPTRGVDVGSIEFLHRRIVAERDSGTPVIIVSTELDEVLELADRIAVLYRGRLMGIVPGTVSRDVLGLMMAGMSGDEALAQAHDVQGGDL